MSNNEFEYKPKSKEKNNMKNETTRAGQLFTWVVIICISVLFLAITARVVKFILGVQ
jgi:hypothetical protein